MGRPERGRGESRGWGKGTIPVILPCPSLDYVSADAAKKENKAMPE